MGHIDCVKYMWERYHLSGGVCFEDFILRGAAESGQLSVFQFVVENNFPVACYRPYLGSLLVDGVFDCIDYLKSMGIII